MSLRFTASLAALVGAVCIVSASIAGSASSSAAAAAATASPAPLEQAPRKPAGADTGLTFDLPQRTASTPQGLVELIAASEQPTAAGELWLALRYQLNPGWHIYWRNPGDSGGPPTVKWQLPAGATAGEFEWPTPTRIPLERLMNFGYENVVVLPLKITLPRGAAGAAAGKPLQLGASLRWLVCKDICVSGKADLSLDLPVAAADRPMLASWAQEIKTARAAVPKPAPTAWRASARPDADHIVLTVLLDRSAPSTAAFFPLDVKQIENAAPQEVTATGKELRIRLRKSEQLTRNPSSLRGVLSLPGGPSVTITAPVSAATASRP